jgi:hypothetical protein
LIIIAVGGTVNASVAYLDGSARDGELGGKSESHRVKVCCWWVRERAGESAVTVTNKHDRMRYPPQHRLVPQRQISNNRRRSISVQLNPPTHTLQNKNNYRHILYTVPTATLLPLSTYHYLLVDMFLFMFLPIRGEALFAAEEVTTPPRAFSGFTVWTFPVARSPERDSATGTRHRRLQFCILTPQYCRRLQFCILTLHFCNLRLERASFFLFRAPRRIRRYFCFPLLAQQFCGRALQLCVLALQSKGNQNCPSICVHLQANAMQARV